MILSPLPENVLFAPNAPISNKPFHHWTRLPSDLKRVVILHLDLRTRRALRRCSKEDKELVEQYPMRHIFRAECEEGFWNAPWRLICQCSWSCWCPNYYHLSRTAVQAYKRLRERLRDVDYVEHLKIDIWQSSSPIILREDRKLLKARCVTLDSRKYPDGLIPVLKQIDMDYMKTFNLLNGTSSHEMYSMLKVDRLFIRVSGITDEQLLNLTCTNVDIESSSLSFAGLIQFLAKAIRNLDKHIEAFFRNITNEILVEIFGSDVQLHRRTKIYFESPFPQYKLEVYVKPKTWFGATTIIASRRNADEVRGGRVVENPNTDRFMLSVKSLSIQE